MKKILVANRGEIALRVMRTAKDMGIQTVAVFSDADRDAPFVRYADEAVHLGPPPSNQSYLLGDKIIEICKELGVDGVHPGYGFLSENAEFARALENAGVTLIGPSAEAMEVMGNKLAAKAAVAGYDIPMVPGTDEAVEDIQEAAKIADGIGFPVLIKAAAGGGGKGMRIVNRKEDFEEQLERAVSEALSSFGDGSVFIERYVTSPRHIEFQILADSHGNFVHVFERECSVQRRHQKVIEEAPASPVDEDLRKRMGEAAINVARSCNYLGAGTVEFLLDENLDFYFLEMNTRLQVEHPVSEMIAGVDLVEEQINIARGLPISFTQDDLEINGHAIEVRVYAEDPVNNFLPDIGKLERYQVPQGPGIRVDGGFEEGMDIPIHYDPMISKLIAHGKDRDQAIRRMIRAIEDYEIYGVATTLEFCRFVLRHDAFTSGNFDTHFVNTHFKPEYLLNPKEDEERIAALLVAKLSSDAKPKQGNTSGTEVNSSNWKRNRKVLG